MTQIQQFEDLWNTEWNVCQSNNLFKLNKKSKSSPTVGVSIGSYLEYLTIKYRLASVGM